MNIVNHGTWTLYVPEVWPIDLPLDIVFCKRDSDGVDWYDFQRGGGLSHESVKMVLTQDIAGAWRVLIATVDGSRLFPENRMVIEVYDGELDTPQESYVNMLYDVNTNTLSVEPLPIPVPTSASKLGLKRAFTERGIWAQVKAMIAANPDAQEEWDLALEVKRSDGLAQSLIAALKAAIGYTDADIDQILIRAKQLTV